MKRLLSATTGRLVVTIALALGVVTSSVFAAEIGSNGRVTGNWSDPAIWTGGVVPGAGDNATTVNLSNITYDAAASGTVGSIAGNGLTLTLKRNLTAQNVYLRESTIVDGGFNLTVSGTLSNGLAPNDNSGNGGLRTGQGGNLFLGNLRLGRSGMYTFYPGDTISGDYTTYTTFNTWPKNVTVIQDPAGYGSRLDQGLSFDGATSQISLGRTSATNQAVITLKWDPGMTGTIDWTLRWKGDHVTDLRNYFANGQIVVGSTPAGKTFDPNSNIFFDSATGYTYVGFKVMQNVGVFVSQQATNGNIGGLAGADAICQAEGQARFPAFAGPWKAWLSDSKTNANVRVAQPGVGGAYVRAADGTTVIARDLATLINASKANLPSVIDPVFALIWTGTGANGAKLGAFSGSKPAEFCGDWTSSAPVSAPITGLPQAWVGNSNQATRVWTENGLGQCNNVAHLYCFSEPTAN